MNKRKKLFSTINRKAQIEMIGLVIVVILLAIGFLFYVKFGILDQDVSSEDPAIEQVYITNLMVSLMNVKVCENDPIQLKEAVVRCFNQELACGESACDYSSGQIKSLINQIGINKYKNYSVWLVKSGKIEYVLNECKTGIQTSTTIISPQNGHYQVYFRVC
jgi:hypothetical protein